MECKLYINLQIPINSSFVILFLVQEFSVNTADMLKKKIFNKYFYIIGVSMVLSRKFPEKFGPGRFFFMEFGSYG